MIQSWTKYRDSSRRESEEDATDPSSGALPLVDEVKLGDELVHSVARLCDGTEIRDEVHVITLLHTSCTNETNEYHARHHRPCLACAPIPAGYTKT